MSTKKAAPSKKDEKESKAAKAKDEPKKAAKAKDEEPEPKKSSKADKDEKPAKVEAKADKHDKHEEKSSKADKHEKDEKPAKVEAKPAKSKGGTSQAKVYQPANSYTVGEQIFHPVWKVEGTVVEVGKTGEGNTKIVVDFPDFGVKRLIAEHSIKL
jgi:hypothetical protein